MSWYPSLKTVVSDRDREPRCSPYRRRHRTATGAGIGKADTAPRYPDVPVPHEYRYISGHAPRYPATRRGRRRWTTRSPPYPAPELMPCAIPVSFLDPGRRTPAAGWAARRAWPNFRTGRSIHDASRAGCRRSCRGRHVDGYCRGCRSRRSIGVPSVDAGAPAVIGSRRPRRIRGFPLCGPEADGAVYYDRGIFEYKCSNSGEKVWHWERVY